MRIQSCPHYRFKTMNKHINTVKRFNTKHIQKQRALVLQ